MRLPSPSHPARVIGPSCALFRGTHVSEGALSDHLDPFESGDWRVRAQVNDLVQRWDRNDAKSGETYDLDLSFEVEVPVGGHIDVMMFGHEADWPPLDPHDPIPTLTASHEVSSEYRGGPTTTGDAYELSCGVYSVRYTIARKG